MEVKNPECKRTFHVLGRISLEKRQSQGWATDIIRKIVEKPCCPYCESIEFETLSEVGK